MTIAHGSRDIFDRFIDYIESYYRSPGLNCPEGEEDLEFFGDRSIDLGSGNESK